VHCTEVTVQLYALAALPQWKESPVFTNGRMWVAGLVVTFLRRRKIVAPNRESNRDSSEQCGQMTVSQLPDLGSDVLFNDVFSY
jgi:hypothetical protein